MTEITGRLSTALADRYRIERYLGEGGIVSRSPAAAGAVHIRVRAMACRSSADSGTPMAAALTCQSASSVGDTRARDATFELRGSADRGRQLARGAAAKARHPVTPWSTPSAP